MTTPRQIRPDTSTPDPDPVDTIACGDCGQPTPHLYGLAIHHGERCQTVGRSAEQIVSWHHDADLSRTAVDPLAALADLHTARARINQLLRTIVRQARYDGASWEQIGAAIRLDPRDTRARYQQP